MGLASNDAVLCRPHPAGLHAAALGRSGPPAQKNAWREIRYKGGGGADRPASFRPACHELCRQRLFHLGVRPYHHHPIRGCGARSHQRTGGSGLYRHRPMGGPYGRFPRRPASVGVRYRSCRHGPVSVELRRAATNQQFHWRHAFRRALRHCQRCHRRHPRHAAVADLPGWCLCPRFGRWRRRSTSRSPPHRRSSQPS